MPCTSLISGRDVLFARPGELSPYLMFAPLCSALPLPAHPSSCAGRPALPCPTIRSATRSLSPSASSLVLRSAPTRPFPSRLLGKKKKSGSSLSHTIIIVHGNREGHHRGRSRRQRRRALSRLAGQLRREMSPCYKILNAVDPQDSLKLRQFTHEI